MLIHKSIIFLQSDGVCTLTSIWHCNDKSKRNEVRNACALKKSRFPSPLSQSTCEIWSELGNSHPVRRGEQHVFLPHPAILENRHSGGWAATDSCISCFSGRSSSFRPFVPEVRLGRSKEFLSQTFRSLLLIPPWFLSWAVSADYGHPEMVVGDHNYTDSAYGDVWPSAFPPRCLCESVSHSLSICCQIIAGNLGVKCA